MAESKDNANTDVVLGNYDAVTSSRFRASLFMEFLGTMFFQVLGATAAPGMAPFVNGFALAVWIYAAANISGGHLNPAVTLSTFLCGFLPLVHAGLYIAVQILGAACGSLITAGLVPGAEVSMGDGGPGCFDHSGAISPQISNSQLFGWEAIMTFTLISSVYACGIAKPGHGSHTPYVVGLALLCCAGSGGQYTGGALNPARVLGPALVFHCGGVSVVLIYLFAHATAALAACTVFGLVSGLGPLNPHLSMQYASDLKLQEALSIWSTGLPPVRVQKGGDTTEVDGNPEQIDVEC